MKKIIVVLAALLMLAGYSYPVSAAAESYENIISSALEYRGNTSSYAGSTDGDWAAFAYGRYYGVPMEGYVHALKKDVSERYDSENKLSAAKSTEWHRIALAALASGEDPRRFTEKNIDLIADGVYNRGETVSLGRQGINGWIWGLIALDAASAEIPENAYYTRADIISEILKLRHSDGGFSLSGSNTGDVDVTASVLTALAPYYEGDGTNEKSVKQAVDDALDFLSSAQLESGGFSSCSVENCESSAQVVTALCTLGIDVENDSLFIKNGHTVIDALISYRNPDGGFCHILGNDSSAYSTDQAVIALISLFRYNNGKTSVYDFSDVVFTKSDGTHNENSSYGASLTESGSSVGQSTKGGGFYGSYYANGGDVGETVPLSEEEDIPSEKSISGGFYGDYAPQKELSVRSPENTGDNSVSAALNEERSDDLAEKSTEVSLAADLKNDKGNRKKGGIAIVLAAVSALICVTVFAVIFKKRGNR